jgi:hypothetical protein
MALLMIGAGGLWWHVHRTPGALLVCAGVAIWSLMRSRSIATIVLIGAAALALCTVHQPAFASFNPYDPGLSRWAQVHGIALLINWITPVAEAIVFFGIGSILINEGVGSRRVRQAGAAIRVLAVITGVLGLAVDIHTEASGRSMTQQPAQVFSTRGGTWASFVVNAWIGYLASITSRILWIGAAVAALVYWRLRAVEQTADEKA